MAVQKAGQAWTGTRIDGPSVCEGTWQPHVRVYVNFQIEKSRHIGERPQEPDICAKCARELVQKLLDQIPTPDRISLAVTQEH